MMMICRSSISITFLFLASCGPAPTVESQYAEYLDRFNREAFNRGYKVDTKSISILTVDKFDTNMGTGTVGVCYEGTGTIEILRSYWDKSTDTTHESVLFHELGHCALFYNHTNNYPAIMYPYVLADSVYIANRSVLLDKFFSNNF